MASSIDPASNVKRPPTAAVYELCPLVPCNSFDGGTRGIYGAISCVQAFGKREILRGTEG